MGQHSSEKKHRSSREDGDSNRKRSKHSSSSKSSSSKSSKPSKEAEEDEWVEAPNTFTPSNLGSNLFGLEDSTDGYGVGEVGDTTGPVTTSSAGDFFSDFGTERKRKEIKKGVDPTVSPINQGCQRHGS